MGVATSIYLIDTPLEVDSERCNWQGARIYTDLEFISISGQYLVLGGCVLPLQTWQRISRARWLVGRLPRSPPRQRTFPCLPLLALLPFPPRAAGPRKLCVPLPRYWMAEGWVLIRGAKELQWGLR